MKLNFWSRLINQSTSKVERSYGSALFIEDANNASSSSSNTNNNNGFLPLAGALKGTASSQVSDGGAYGSAARQGIVTPNPDFSTRLEAYDTIAKIYAAVESYVKTINKRDYYFANVDEESTDDRGIEIMDQWDKDYHGSWLLDCISRDLLIFGNSIVSSTDWLPVQMTSVIYMRRGADRKPIEIMLSVNGQWVPLGNIYNPKTDKYDINAIPIQDFIHIKDVDVNQEAWGRGLYHPILTTFKDVDNKQSTPIYQWTRQLQQDGGKIYHKMASPRTFYGFPSIMNKDEYNPDNPNSLAAKIRRMGNGDRLMVQGEINVASEPIDGKSRFTEIKADIMDETEVATQSSASRLITKPSAMADAKQANEKDDDTALNLMEILRRFMNEEVIPRVLQVNGIDPEKNAIEFRWGKEDEFEFDFADIVYMANLQIGGQPVVSIEEIRDMLKRTGTPLDDLKYQQFMDAKAQAAAQLQQQMMMANTSPNQGDNNNNNNPNSPKDTTNPGMQTKVKAPPINQT